MYGMIYDTYSLLVLVGIDTKKQVTLNIALYHTVTLDRQPHKERI